MLVTIEMNIADYLRYFDDTTTGQLIQSILD